METHVTSKIDAIDAVEQIQYIVGELENIGTMDSVSVYEIFNLAIKIQENIIKSKYNELYSRANVVDTYEPAPSALEKIAMELEKFNSNNS
jgi:hypothetical protein